MLGLCLCNKVFFKLGMVDSEKKLCASDFGQTAKMGGYEQNVDQWGIEPQTFRMQSGRSTTELQARFRRDRHPVVSDAMITELCFENGRKLGVPRESPQENMRKRSTGISRRESSKNQGKGISIEKEQLKGRPLIEKEQLNGIPLSFNAKGHYSQSTRKEGNLAAQNKLN